MRIQIYKMSGEPDTFLVFTIQAETHQLKDLFRKREDIEGILKQSEIFQDCSSLALYNAFNFFLPNVEKFVPPEREEKMEKESRFVIDPVIKMYVKLNQSQIEVVKDCIEKIQDYTAVHFSANEDMTYQMLDILFDFVHDRRNQFCAFLSSDGIIFPSEKKIADKCQICFEEAESLYYDVSICLKCKFFFQGIMRRRTLLSLRCSKSGDCCSKNDISCRKCRFERCRLANMVETYCHSELLEYITGSCLVCQKDDGKNIIVLGYYFCADCMHLLNDLLQSNKKPICLKEPERRCATYECPKCFKAILFGFGLFYSYKMKTNGLKHRDRYFTSTECCVCHRPVSQTSLWMDLIVCIECRAFLKVSLNYDNYILYSCPSGEIEQLCPVASDMKCPYCWFLRMEVEGVIERWQICNGDPSKWSEIQAQINYPSVEDQNQEERKVV